MLRAEREISQVIAGIEQKVEDKQEDLNQIQSQLKLAKESLAQMKAEKKQIEENLSGYREALGSRMRAVYMMGDLTYLELLFTSGSFSDFVDRVYYVQTICGRDESLIDKTQQDQELLVSKVDQISQKIQEIAKIRDLHLAEKNKLKELQEEKESSLEAVATNKELYLRQIREIEEDNKRLERLLRNAGNSASGYKGKPWSGSFRKPCPGPITSGFGYRSHPIFGGRRMHYGVDIGAPKGTAIVAGGNGKVIFTGYQGGYGLTVIIDHGGGRTTLYGHCSRITCDAGQEVKTGTKIAEVGSTGNSTGNHCHFEVRVRGIAQNPLNSI
jgi:murein DD-endopeptidase MepM/ murein hydrolase activator NlpD